MLNKLPSIRKMNVLAAMITLFLLSAASYLQYSRNIIPCPLCILQRYVYMLLAVLFLMGILLPVSRWTVRIHNVIIAACAGVGIVAAARQIWLQHMPPSPIASCSMDFYYIMHNFPATQVIMSMFQSTVDCAKVSFSLLGLSLASWSMIWLVVLFAIAWVQVLRT